LSSSEWVRAIESAQPYLYGGLAIIGIIQWRRRGGPASAWLAASLTVHALVLIAGRLLPETPTDPALVWARKALIATLVLFPYFLYRFMISLIRPIGWFKVVAAVLTVGVAAAALLLPPVTSQTTEPQPGWLQAYVALLLIQWVLLSGVVAVRLWRAGRGQPTVARRRMRTMSLGASGLALALVVAGEFSRAYPGTAIVVQLLVLTAAPLMLVGFAPPYILRASWRRREEAALKEAELALVRATTASEVASTLLPHARSLLGAAAVVLEGADRNIVASEGLDQHEARAAMNSLEAGTRSDPGQQRSLVTIPMQTGRLTAIASPFTPFFGADEVASLEGLAALADLALARNELLESSRRLAAIVESSGDAIISKSLGGTILAWNRGAERIYGYRSEEVVGKPISILVPADIKDDVVQILEKVRRGENIQNYETRRQTKNGTVIDVSVTVSPIRDGSGRITAVSTIARDVTAGKQLEREREKAREDADRANQAKNEFLSRMSHELRTPLNAVLGFAQLLEMDSLTPEQKDWIKEILKAGQHLLELIDEVLDISRIEAGQLRLSLEPVDAVQAVQECISLLAPLATEEGVSLRLAPSGDSGSRPYVRADRQRLKQVLLNLISNGIKYNRQDGSVEVSFDRADRDGRLRICVADTGVGIPSESLEQAFSPFERLAAEGSAVEGTGLGLALSRALVEAMGGTIALTSELGRGATFSVDLAVAETPDIVDESQSDLEDHSLAETTPRTVLYIEDNFSNLKLVQTLLERRPDIQLIPAMQGSIGVTLARDHNPDLVLLDLNLPDMPGEEVLGRLRSDPQTASLPVIVITADATSGQVKRLLKQGARAYLTKPLEVKRFLELVDLFCS